MADRHGTRTQPRRSCSERASVFNDDAPQRFLPPVSFPYGAAHASGTRYLFDLPTAPIAVEGGGQAGAGLGARPDQAPFRVRERITGWVPREPMAYELIDGMRVRGHRAAVKLGATAAKLGPATMKIMRVLRGVLSDGARPGPHTVRVMGPGI